jgi:LmbE family N-acetylglucosaminyl deacetylase
MRDAPNRAMSRRALLGAGLVTTVGAVLSTRAPGVAASVRPLAPLRDAASGGSLITVAHADDNLLFMSPYEPHLARSGAAVTTVYLTTGDAGLGSGYWLLREAGARAGTATIADRPNNWRRQRIVINGYRLNAYTLTADPRYTIIFFRLPDGNSSGAGWANTDYETLGHLWSGTLGAIHSADGARYTRQQLINTLSALLRRFHPTTVLTQNFNGSFGNGDHPDHIATAFLTIAAEDQLTAKVRKTIGFQGYPIHLLPANVFGGDLLEKEKAFFRYSLYDSHGCTSVARCNQPGFPAATYGSWLQRQYVTGTKT